MDSVSASAALYVLHIYKYSVIGSLNNPTASVKCFLTDVKVGENGDLSMVRLSHFKNVVAAFLTILILLYIYKLNFCNNANIIISNIEDIDEEDSFDHQSKLKDLNCVLNREVAKNVGYKQAVTKKIRCKSDGSEVYVPFSFIKHYYEARGDWVGKSSEKSKEFEISHSYSRVYTPTSQYRSDGQFMHFRTFNVEARSRVLCLAADTGVPVTTQWDPKGIYLQRIYCL